MPASRPLMRVTRRGGGVELLRDTDEGDLVSLEGLHDAREVEQRAGESVDLVTDDRVDLARLDVCQQAEQGGPICGTSGEATVVKTVWRGRPALMGLALDVGLPRLALGVQRLELRCPHSPP